MVSNHLNPEHCFSGEPLTLLQGFWIAEEVRLAVARSGGVPLERGVGVECPVCRAHPNECCTDRLRRTRTLHRSRAALAADLEELEATEPRPCPACRTPVTPYGSFDLEADRRKHTPERCRDRLKVLLEGSEAALSVASDRLTRAGNPR